MVRILMNGLELLQPIPVEAIEVFSTQTAPLLMGSTLQGMGEVALQSTIGFFSSSGKADVVAKAVVKSGWKMADVVQHADMVVDMVLFGMVSGVILVIVGTVLYRITIKKVKRWSYRVLGVGSGGGGGRKKRKVKVTKKNQKTAY